MESPRLTVSRVSGNIIRNQNESAIENYLTSLTLFSKSKNKEGEAKVNNNIGNLYRDVDYDKSLRIFQPIVKNSPGIVYQRT